MMFPFFPYYRRRTTYNYTPNSYNFPHSVNSNACPTSNKICNNSNFNNTAENCDNTCLNEKSNDKVFDFLGLSFHFDDLLLIGLLFLLYQNDCDDYYLFVILFLLLLSN